MSQPTVTVTAPPRPQMSKLANIINLVMIPLAIALVIVTATDTQSHQLRQTLTIIVYLLAPGSGLVQFLRLPTASLQLGVLFALSAAVNLLMAQGLLSINHIDATTAAWLIAAVTCIRPLRITNPYSKASA